MRAACARLIYLAGGDNNTIIASNDGKAWTSFEVHHIQGDDYINFISVERGVVTTTSLPGAYQSLDGARTFTLHALAQNVRVQAAAYPDGHYLAAGSIGGTSALLLSGDGLSWTTPHALSATETFDINGPRVALGWVPR